MAREIPTRRNRENAGGLGENPLALTIPYVACLLDNFAGELSCLRSCQRLRQQEGQNPNVVAIHGSRRIFGLPEQDNNEWERSIMNVSKTVALAASSALALGSIVPACAHELRILPANHGKISLLVGFHVEPAFEDSFNAVDVILSTFDGACPAPNASVSIGQPIDADGTMAAKDPDTVNLKVDALYLLKAVRPTGPFGSIAPAGIEAKLTITDASPLAEGFRNPGTYDSYFRPTHPGNATTGGAYGFHIYGKVHAGPNSFSCPGDKTPRPLAARTATINAYYVCSVAGSLAAPDNFGCVTAIQPFPGDAGDGYEPDSAFNPH